MPIRVDVVSLKEICMSKICRNLTIYSTNDLKILPCDLTEDLINLYDEFLRRDDTMEFCTLKQRNRLIRPDIKKLNLCFPSHRKLFTKIGAYELSEICMNLTHLDCQYLGSAKKDFRQLILSIPNIVVLKLTVCKSANDDLLVVIGDNCFQLEILELPDSAVTNVGVQRFVQSKSGGAKLEELDLEGSKVTVNGCVAALLNLSQLKHFKCYHFVREAFLKLFKDKNEISPLQLCDLLDMYVKRIPNGFLNFIVNSCPNLRQLTLISSLFDTFDGILQDMLTCRENVTFSLKVNCDEKIIGTLSSIGFKVTALHLSLSKINLESIGITCPNLRELSLMAVAHSPVNYMTRNDGQVIPFSKLISFKLECDSLLTNFDQLLFVFERCLDLQELKIECCEQFTDDMLFTILYGTNRLRKLTSFSLSFCNEVSVAPIFELLAMENDLETLVISDCQNFPEVVCLQIKLFIRENNLNVTLDTDKKTCYRLYD